MNETVNWEEFKVRCSSIVKVLANSRANSTLTENQEKKLRGLREKLQRTAELTKTQSKELVKLEAKEANGSKIMLAETCIEYLMVEYAWLVEGKIPVGKESLDLVATRKGNIVELDSMVLLTRVDGVFYKIHTKPDSNEKERIYNDFLSGEIDYYHGPHVMRALAIVDNKASFDLPTFLKKIHTGLEYGQREQVQGYLDITGAPVGWIANTLVDCPDELVEDMRWKLANRMGAITIESPSFLKKWEIWERSMKFNDMAPQKRVHKIRIHPFSAATQQKLYDRVKVCRDFLADFHDRYQKYEFVNHG